ncbi:hypothetical protein F66182_8284 [Fusarium sp. NRRL 66182]|nr:hypothetical protein F66182_8284 [Fusarium sp. NRRL 66182]
MPNYHVRDSMRQIDDNSWLIGDKILISRTSSSECTWGGSDGGYTVSETPYPLPETQPASANADIERVEDMGDQIATFRIGDALCKVKDIRVPQATREHVTLAWLKERTWSFAIPEVLYHAEHDGRYYLITRRLPGKTLDKVWFGLDEPTKQYYVERVADICRELAVPAPTDNNIIAGVDGNFLAHGLLTGADKDCNPRKLHKNCLEYGMDCSNLVFFNCELAPDLIVVDGIDRPVGISGWETAGFLPKEWIMTDFRVCSGLDLPKGNRAEWRGRVACRLGQLGFSEVTEAYMDPNAVWRRRKL